MTTMMKSSMRVLFQYRKRDEVTCDQVAPQKNGVPAEFQYRKRYEVTCDDNSRYLFERIEKAFQYRKRYEVTCDSFLAVHISSIIWFQYRKRYEVTCDNKAASEKLEDAKVSIPQAV